MDDARSGVATQPTLTLLRSSGRRRLAAVAGSEQHPQWCSSSDGPEPCGDHLSDAIDVPATAGRWRVDGDGGAFPRVETAAVQQHDGTPAVWHAIFDPTGEVSQWVPATLTPAEARKVAAALVAQADLAEYGAGGLREVARP